MRVVNKALTASVTITCPVLASAKCCASVLAPIAVISPLIWPASVPSSALSSTSLALISQALVALVASWHFTSKVVQANPCVNWGSAAICWVPVVQLSPTKAHSTLLLQAMSSRGVSSSLSRILIPTLTLAAHATPGWVLISIEVRWSLPASLVGSGTKGSKGLVLVLSNSLIATIFIYENEK